MLTCIASKTRTYINTRTHILCKKGSILYTTYHKKTDKLATTNSTAFWHYSDVIMSAIASQITGISIVYPAVCSGVNQRKHQKLRVTCLSEGNSPVIREFPAQRASDAENASIMIWWRHHDPALLLNTIGLLPAWRNHPPAARGRDRQPRSAVAIYTCEVQVSAADSQTVPTVATGVSKLKIHPPVYHLLYVRGT